MPPRSKKTLINLADDFISLFYPRLCFCCERPLMKQENIICIKCNIGMPRTHYHLMKDNPVEKLFWGRTNIQRATSYFIYQKGSRYQHLIYELKYKGQRDIGVFLGKQFASELSEVSYFDDVDVVVPVPLHPRKERKRAYNQSEAIAEGLNQVLCKKLETKNLVRKIWNESQTSRGRYDRWENVHHLFTLQDNKQFENKHILLVDDVLTTGSTIEACAAALQKTEGIKISVITLGYSCR